MKRIFVVFVLLLLLVSCSNKDEVVEEIIHYYNEEWISIIDMKQESLNEFPWELNELAENHQYDEAIALIKDEYFPVVNIVIERLEAVEPENRQVKKINDMQIEAEQFAKEAFENSVIYFEGGDVSENDIEQYNEGLQEKYQDVLDYRDNLMDKYNLEKVENEDSDSAFDKLKPVED